MPIAGYMQQNPYYFPLILSLDMKQFKSPKYILASLCISIKF